MPQMSHPKRIVCTIRLEQDNNRFLDEEVARTGKSRSDIVNRAIKDHAEFWDRVNEIIVAQNDILLKFAEEMRANHKDRKKEHEQILQILDKIRNSAMFQSETTKP